MKTYQWRNFRVPRNQIYKLKDHNLNTNAFQCKLLHLIKDAAFIRFFRSKDVCQEDGRLPASFSSIKDNYSHLNHEGQTYQSVDVGQGTDSVLRPSHRPCWFYDVLGSVPPWPYHKASIWSVPHSHAGWTLIWTKRNVLLWEPWPRGGYTEIK